LNPDPDPANFVNPDPDPGLKKLFKNKVLKLNLNGLFNYNFFDQIYFYLDSRSRAGGILEPGTVFFRTTFLKFSDQKILQFF
jgi:hypothetical protein